MMNKIYLFAAILILFLSQSMAERYIWLNAPVSAPPYDSWNNAATNIQDAVNVATNTETVWVTNGNYALTNQIVITNGCTLRSVKGRDYTFINGNYPLYSNRCFYINNATSIVDGFMISNAYYSNSTIEVGGGVHIESGKMQNCTIFSNYYHSYPYESGGGGVAMRQHAIVSNCLIYNNSVLGGRGGGGVWMYGGQLVDCIVSNNRVATISGGSSWGGGVLAHYSGGNQIINSTIANNRSTDRGGGIYCYRLTAAGCTVIGNYASRGGGCYAGTYTSSFFNSTFSENNNGNDGAALETGSDSTSLVVNCVFSNNYNGAIETLNVGTFSNCVIISNSSVDIRGCIWQRIATNYFYNCVIRENGGRVYIAGGYPYFYNCVIERNSSRGIYIDGGEPTISGCTVVSNYTSDKGGGITITSANSNVRISNCIVFSNTAAGGYNDIWDATAGNIHSTNIIYSCAGSFAGFSGVGNITNVNPLFVDFAGRNYRLSPNSPCINVGINETWMTNAVDLDEKRRIYYGTVDMGAYEMIYNGTIYTIP